MATSTIEGTTDALWSRAANWDGGASVPETGDNVTIPALSCEFDAAAAAFELSEGCTLTIDGDAGAAVFTVNKAGLTTVAGSFLNLYAITSSNLDCNVAFAFNGNVYGEGNASITVSGDITIGPSADFSGYSGSFTRDGATTPTTITNSNTVIANAPPLIINAAGTTTNAANAQKFRTFTLTAGTYADGGFPHSIAGSLLINGGTFTNTGAWTQTASGNVRAAYANRFANITLAATAGVTSTFTGTVCCIKFAYGAGVVVGGAFELQIYLTASNFFISGTGILNLPELLIRGPASVSNGAIDVSNTTGKVTVRLNAGATLTLTGDFDIGAAALYLFSNAAGVATISMGSNTLTAGAVTIGNIGALDYCGVINFGTGSHKIASLAAGNAANLNNAVDFGSCYLSLSGILNGANTAPSTNVACHVQGGTVQNVDNVSAEYIHCHGTADGTGNTNVDFDAHTPPGSMAMTGCGI